MTDHLLSDSLKIFLYPLGFLSAVVFLMRLLIQWLESEKAKKSLVHKNFWYLSILGNTLSMLHSLIQLQFHVFITQACNAIFSWRNLNLMKPLKERASFLCVIFWLSFALLLSPVLFYYFTGFQGFETWFRIPLAPWQSRVEGGLPFYWHMFGFLGVFLFSLRFWIQWWQAEKKGVSYLSSTFFWVSLTGNIFCLIYFIKIQDTVNFLGPLFGLIPYIRNLMLIYKKGNKNPYDTV